jgi:hypothetical protein
MPNICLGEEGDDVEFMGREIGAVILQWHGENIWELRGRNLRCGKAYPADLVF